MKPSLLLACLAIGIALSPASVLAAPGSASSPINVNALNIKKTSQIKVWKSNIEFRDKIGKFGSGLFCSDKVDIPYSKGLDEYHVMRISKAFAERNATLGYPKFEGEESAFADKLGTEADFKVGLTLLSLDYNLCGDNKEYSGTSTIKLKVELYSTKTKRVTYSNTLSGSFSSEKKIKSEAFDDGLLNSALDVMYSDPKYVEVFRDAEAVAAVGDVVSVANGSKPVDGLKKNTKELSNLVVTIESSLGSGSGFFIGNGGHIVSNYHVVGEAKFVKVKVGGGHAVIGEVLRKDEVRDVVLIKTPLEPPTSLAVRRTAPKVGEEVYAIGSPFGAMLSGTTTRGIISAERTVDGLRFIQSDVAINPGNSGGPLLDGDGEALAMAVLQKGDAAGISLFIPISEVLEKLGIKMKY